MACIVVSLVAFDGGIDNWWCHCVVCCAVYWIQMSSEWRQTPSLFGSCGRTDSQEVCHFNKWDTRSYMIIAIAVKRTSRTGVQPEQPEGFQMLRSRRQKAEILNTTIPQRNMILSKSTRETLSDTPSLSEVFMSRLLPAPIESPTTNVVWQMAYCIRFNDLGTGSVSSFRHQVSLNQRGLTADNGVLNLAVYSYWSTHSQTSFSPSCRMLCHI